MNNVFHLLLQTQPVDVTAKWVDIVWKIGTPLGMIAVYFLKTQFLPKKDYYNDRNANMVKLNEMDRKLDALANNEERLRDHETRLRELEHSHR